jgi:hypothetical protein
MKTLVIVIQQTFPQILKLSDHIFIFKFIKIKLSILTQINPKLNLIKKVLNRLNDILLRDNLIMSHFVWKNGLFDQTPTHLQQLFRMPIPNNLIHFAMYEKTGTLNVLYFLVVLKALFDQGGNYSAEEVFDQGL